MPYNPGPSPSAMMQRRRIPTKTLASAFSFFLLFLAIGAASPEANARDAERTALLQLKSSVSDPADLLIGWSATPGSDHCSWRGVSCDSRSRVVSLNISARASGGFSPYSSCSRSGPFLRGCSDPRRRLAGKLSPAVGKLSELRVLSLPFHGFDGEIPGEIWGLDNLEVLDLEGNSLSGSFPFPFPLPARSSSGSSWSGFDDHGRALGLSSAEEEVVGSKGKIVRAVPKAKDQQDVKNSVQKFRVVRVFWGLKPNFFGISSSIPPIKYN